MVLGVSCRSPPCRCVTSGPPAHTRLRVPFVLGSSTVSHLPCHGPSYQVSTRGSLFFLHNLRHRCDRPHHPSLGPSLFTSVVLLPMTGFDPPTPRVRLVPKGPLGPRRPSSSVRPRLSAVPVGGESKLSPKRPPTRGGSAEGVGGERPLVPSTGSGVSSIPQREG